MDPPQKPSATKQARSSASSPPRRYPPHARGKPRQDQDRRRRKKSSRLVPIKAVERRRPVTQGYGGHAIKLIQAGPRVKLPFQRTHDDPTRMVMLEQRDGRRVIGTVDNGNFTFTLVQNAPGTFAQLLAHLVFPTQKRRQAGVNRVTTEALVQFQAGGFNDRFRHGSVLVQPRDQGIVMAIVIVIENAGADVALSHKTQAVQMRILEL